MRFVNIPILIILLTSSSCYGVESKVLPDYSKTPVLFVHGLGCNKEYWNTMVKYLINKGFPKRYLKKIDLIPSDGSNIMHAEKLIAPAIEEYLDSINVYLEKNHKGIKEKDKVDIISHSMGAVSTRWYCAKVKPERVRSWISLAGANHGSNAVCEFNAPGPMETCPAFVKSARDSYLQYELNGEPHIPDVDETPFGLGEDSPGVNTVPPDGMRSILYITLRIDPDKWIKPEDSAMVDGAGGIEVIIPKDINIQITSPGNYLLVNYNDHDGIVQHSDTIELINAILSQR